MLQQEGGDTFGRAFRIRKLDVASQWHAHDNENNIHGTTDRSGDNDNREVA